MLKNWINILLYHTKNNKLFTVLNVLGLSIGMAGLIFATLYWNEEQSYNAWNPNKERVFQVLSEISGENIWSSNPAALKPFLEKHQDIESVLFTDNWYTTDKITYNGKKEIIEKIYNCENTFFKFFPFRFIYGDAVSALKDESSVAISEKKAESIFGHQNPVGKQIKFGDKILVVRGVYRLQGKSSVAPEMVINLMKEKINENKDQWGNYNFGLLLKLKDASKAANVKIYIENLFYQYKVLKEAKSEGVSPEDFIKKQGKTQQILESLSGSRLHSVVDGMPEGRGHYQFLLIMMSLSILILLLSIVNYINLATASAIKRAKEVGVRKIIGASKSNIVKQFIFETILTTLFSIFLALVIVELSLPYYNDFLGKTLVIHGGQFYMQLLIIFIITVIFTGIFPAVYVSNFKTLKVLKGNFGRSKNGVWLRNGMLILQFAIAAFFIIGSYIVSQQINFLNNREIGFKGNQVIRITYRKPDFDYKEKRIGKKLFGQYLVIKQELSKINGVEQVSNGAFTFGGTVNSSSSFSFNNISIQGQNMAIDFGMLDMMKIKLVQGRNLDERFASDTINSMMVNETALKMMKEKNPIGKTVNWNENKLKIIGVVKDFNIWGPQGKIPPMAFFHFKTIDWMSMNMNNVYVKIKSESMQNTIASLEKFWSKNVDTEYPFRYDFVDKEYARSYETYVKQKNLFELLNIIVILIALFGLFSLASFSIERQMKEIAIRKTLGAETNVLLIELSKQYIIFCVIGFLIAVFPAYYLLNKWLENFAFRIDVSIYPFLIGFVALLSLMLLVVLSRAYQATRVDVLKYLKYE